MGEGLPPPEVKVETFLINILNGFCYGMLLFIISVGLTIIFGVMGVLNFAHGSFYMLGAYLCLFITSHTSNFWLSLLLAPLGVALLGVAAEVFLLRPIYSRDASFQLLLTFGLLLILDDAVKLIWGAGYHSVEPPKMLSGTVSILGSTYPIYSLFIAALGPILAASIWLFFHKTPHGRMIRAAAMDREMAAAVGINVPLLFSAVFFMGTYLAGLAGVLAAPLRAIGPAMGDNIIISAFIVVVIGGLGSFPGAFAGAVILGLVESLGIQFVPRLQMALPYILLALVLLIKPKGLFGRE